jgi:hypothetical protein
MKEAPEKIYMSPAGILYKGDKQQSNDIEYTRTDAFIEKAHEWLRLNLSNYFDDTRETFELFIDDFRKYLKEK